MANLFSDVIAGYVVDPGDPEEYDQVVEKSDIGPSAEKELGHDLGVALLAGTELSDEPGAAADTTEQEYLSGKDSYVDGCREEPLDVEQSAGLCIAELVPTGQVDEVDDYNAQMGRAPDQVEEVGHLVTRLGLGTCHSLVVLDQWVADHGALLADQAHQMQQGDCQYENWPYCHCLVK